MRDHQPDLALQHYQEGLDRARANGNVHVQEVFLGQIGALHTNQGRYSEAEEAFNTALELAEQSGEAFRRARALLNLGAYFLRRGDLVRAQSILEESLDVARKAGDPITVGLALGNLADVFLKQHNPSYALRLLREAAPQALTHPPQASYLLGRMGQAHLALNEPDQGRKYLGQAIRLAEQNNQPQQELIWSTLLGDQAFREGQIEDAVRLYQRAQQLADRVAIAPPEYDSLRVRAHLAMAYHRLGRQSEALSLAESVLEEARAKNRMEVEGQMLSTLGGIHQMLGNPEAAIRALESAIDLYTDRLPNDTERVKAMVTLGALYQESGQVEKALEVFEEAMQNAGDADRSGRAQTLRRIGAVLHRRGEFQAALDKWLEALSLFEQGGEHAQMARLLCDIAGVRRTLSGVTAAMPDYERATVLLNNVKDTATRGVVLSNVANLYTDLGEIETAKSFYEEALELARQSGNRRAESLRLGNYAWYHIMIGQPREAIRLLEMALSISRELNDPLIVPVQMSNLALAHHELKDYQRAEDLYRRAIEAITPYPDPRWAAMFRANLARTLLAQGRTEEAITLLEQALPVSRAARDQETVVRIQSRLGEAYLRQGRTDEADQAAAEAETLARKWGYRKGQADALVVRASIAQARNDSAARVRFLKEAQRLYNIVHDPQAEQIARALGDA